MKKFFFGVFFSFLFFSVSSAGDAFQIVPEAKSGVSVDKAIQDVQKSGGSVRDNYNKQAEKFDKSNDLGAQFASGIFTWNTLFNYIARLVKFLSQLGLVIGAGFIIYAGYQYAMASFGNGNPSDAQKAITNAVYGVIVLTFSYAILRVVITAFLE